ncbi:MAG: cytochrome P450 [Thermostichales cyanobacterium HHBFW_bins_127]
MRSLPQPFYWQEFGLWCFARWRDVNALLRDRRFGRQILHLTTREELGWAPVPADLQFFDQVDNATMIQMEPPDHTRLRGVMQKAFAEVKMDSLRSQIQSLCNQLVDDILTKTAVDLLPAYAVPVAVITIAQLLGVPGDMGEHLRHWSQAMVAMYELGRTPQQESRAVAATQAFYAYLSQLIQERRRDPREDMLSRLIAVVDQSQLLTEHELIASCMQFLNAGHEATVHVIGNGVYALLRHPQIWQQLTRDPGLSRLAVEELLRFDTPLHLFTRWVLEDLDYGGHRFRCGDTVALLLAAANRDPERFVEPDRLDLGRTDNPHLAFGGGIHFCLGAPLARLELEIALRTLACRLPGLRLAVQPQYRNSYHFRGLTALPLHIR